MKILFLSAWYPYPADNGSKLRISALLQGLASHHEVTLISFGTRSDKLDHAPELSTLCRSQYILPWKPFKPNGWRARLGYFSSKPRVVVDIYSREMELCIRQALATTDFDLVIASEFTMAMYSALFRPVPALLEDLELGTYYEQYSGAVGWRRLRYGLTWYKHRRWLTSILPNFRACTLVSHAEYHLARHAVPTYQSFDVVPNCVQLDEYTRAGESPTANTLIFAGSFSFYPNYEAMCWFLREVFPLIRSAVPETQLTITGNHLDYPLPVADNVTLTGYVSNVHPYIRSSWVSLAPIHQGAGTRLKILEAMALRSPVVATSKGAEGLEVQNGEHILIADSPQEFAEAVIRLLREPELRKRLVDNGYRLIQERYDWKSVMPNFLNLVERVTSTPARTNGH